MPSRACPPNAWLGFPPEACGAGATSAWASTAATTSRGPPRPGDPVGVVAREGQRTDGTRAATLPMVAMAPPPRLPVCGTGWNSKGTRASMAICERNADGGTGCAGGDPAQPSRPGVRSPVPSPRSPASGQRKGSPMGHRVWWRHEADAPGRKPRRRHAGGHDGLWSAGGALCRHHRAPVLAGVRPGEWHPGPARLHPRPAGREAVNRNLAARLDRDRTAARAEGRDSGVPERGPMRRANAHHRIRGVDGDDRLSAGPVRRGHDGCRTAGAVGAAAPAEVAVDADGAPGHGDTRWDSSTRAQTTLACAVLASAGRSSTGSDRQSATTSDRWGPRPRGRSRRLAPPVEGRIGPHAAERFASPSGERRSLVDVCSVVPPATSMTSTWDSLLASVQPFTIWIRWRESGLPGRIRRIGACLLRPSAVRPSERPLRRPARPVRHSRRGLRGVRRRRRTARRCGDRWSRRSLAGGVHRRPTTGCSAQTATRPRESMKPPGTRPCSRRRSSTSSSMLPR